VIEELSTSQPLVPVSTPPVPALPAMPLPELPPLPAPPVAGPVKVDIAVVLPLEPRLPELPAFPVPSPAATATVPNAPQGMGQVPMPVRDATGHGGVGSRPPSETPIAPASEIPRGHRAGERSQPPSATRAGKASRHARGPMLPPSLPNPLHVVGSGGASGGIVPSALLLGLATVIGFFILAAPGLGRRIRPARELRPRSRYQAPIDDPG
jgi:hypothetical protein